MKRIDDRIVGELEDVRPCDNCGDDYVFLIGEDPGKCGTCLRTVRQLAEAEKVLRREGR